MRPRDPRVYLYDGVAAAEAIRLFIAGRTLADTTVWDIATSELPALSAGLAAELARLGPGGEA